MEYVLLNVTDQEIILLHWYMSLIFGKNYKIVGDYDNSPGNNILKLLNEIRRLYEWF